MDIDNETTTSVCSSCPTTKRKAIDPPTIETIKDLFFINQLCFDIWDFFHLFYVLTLSSVNSQWRNRIWKFKYDERIVSRRISWSYKRRKMKTSMLMSDVHQAVENLLETTSNCATAQNYSYLFHIKSLTVNRVLPVYAQTVVLFTMLSNLTRLDLCNVGQQKYSIYRSQFMVISTRTLLAVAKYCNQLHTLNLIDCGIMRHDAWRVFGRFSTSLKQLCINDKRDGLHVVDKITNSLVERCLLDLLPEKGIQLTHLTLHNPFYRYLSGLYQPDLYKLRWRRFASEHLQSLCLDVGWLTLDFNPDDLNPTVFPQLRRLHLIQKEAPVDHIEIPPWVHPITFPMLQQFSYTGWELNSISMQRLSLLQSLHQLEFYGLLYPNFLSLFAHRDLLNVAGGGAPIDFQCLSNLTQLRKIVLFNCLPCDLLQSCIGNHLVRQITDISLYLPFDFNLCNLPLIGSNQIMQLIMEFQSLNKLIISKKHYENLRENHPSSPFYGNFLKKIECFTTHVALDGICAFSS